MRLSKIKEDRLAGQKHCRDEEPDSTTNVTEKTEGTHPDHQLRNLLDLTTSNCLLCNEPVPHLSPQEYIRHLKVCKESAPRRRPPLRGRHLITQSHSMMDVSNNVNKKDLKITNRTRSRHMSECSGGIRNEFHAESTSITTSTTSIPSTSSSLQKECKAKSKYNLRTDKDTRVKAASAAAIQNVTKEAAGSLKEETHESPNAIISSDKQTKSTTHHRNTKKSKKCKKSKSGHENRGDRDEMGYAEYENSSESDEFEKQMAAIKNKLVFGNVRGETGCEDSEYSNSDKETDSDNDESEDTEKQKSTAGDGSENTVKENSTENEVQKHTDNEKSSLNAESENTKGQRMTKNTQMESSRRNKASENMRKEISKGNDKPKNIQNKVSLNDKSENMEKENSSENDKSESAEKENSNGNDESENTEKGNSSGNVESENTETENSSGNDESENTEKGNSSGTDESEKTEKGNSSGTDESENTEKGNSSGIDESENTEKGNSSGTDESENTEKENFSGSDKSESTEKENSSGSDKSESTEKENSSGNDESEYTENGNSSGNDESENMENGNSSGNDESETKEKRNSTGNYESESTEKRNSSGNNESENTEKENSPENNESENTGKENSSANEESVDIEKESSTGNDEFKTNEKDVSRNGKSENIKNWFANHKSEKTESDISQSNELKNSAKNYSSENEDTGNNIPRKYSENEDSNKSENEDSDNYESPQRESFEDNGEEKSSENGESENTEQENITQDDKVENIKKETIKFNSENAIKENSSEKGQRKSFEGQTKDEVKHNINGEKCNRILPHSNKKIAAKIKILPKSENIDKSNTKGNEFADGTSIQSDKCKNNNILEKKPEFILNEDGQLQQTQEDPMEINSESYESNPRSSKSKRERKKTMKAKKLMKENRELKNLDAMYEGKGEELLYFKNGNAKDSEEAKYFQEENVAMEVDQWEAYKWENGIESENMYWEESGALTRSKTKMTRNKMAKFYLPGRKKNSDECTDSVEMASYPQQNTNTIIKSIEKLLGAEKRDYCKNAKIKNENRTETQRSTKSNYNLSQGVVSPQNRPLYSEIVKFGMVSTGLENSVENEKKDNPIISPERKRKKLRKKKQRNRAASENSMMENYDSSNSGLGQKRELSSPGPSWACKLPKFRKKKNTKRKPARRNAKKTAPSNYRPDLEATVHKWMNTIPAPLLEIPIKEEEFDQQSFDTSIKLSEDNIMETSCVPSLVSENSTTPNMGTTPPKTKGSLKEYPDFNLTFAAPQNQVSSTFADSQNVDECSSMSIVLDSDHLESAKVKSEQKDVEDIEMDTDAMDGVKDLISTYVLQNPVVETTVLYNTVEEIQNTNDEQNAEMALPSSTNNDNDEQMSENEDGSEPRDDDVLQTLNIADIIDETRLCVQVAIWNIIRYLDNRFLNFLNDDAYSEFHLSPYAFHPKIELPANQNDEDDDSSIIVPQQALESSTLANDSGPSSMQVVSDAPPLPDDSVETSSACEAGKTGENTEASSSTSFSTSPTSSGQLKFSSGFSPPLSASPSAASSKTTLKLASPTELTTPTSTPLSEVSAQHFRELQESLLGIPHSDESQSASNQEILNIPHPEMSLPTSHPEMPLPTSHPEILLPISQVLPRQLTHRDASLSVIHQDRPRRISQTEIHPGSVYQNLLPISRPDMPQQNYHSDVPLSIYIPEVQAPISRTESSLPPYRPEIHLPMSYSEIVANSRPKMQFPIARPEIIAGHEMPISICRQEISPISRPEIIAGHEIPIPICRQERSPISRPEIIASHEIPISICRQEMSPISRQEIHLGTTRPEIQVAMTRSEMPICIPALVMPQPISLPALSNYCPEMAFPISRPEFSAAISRPDLRSAIYRPEMANFRPGMPVPICRTEIPVYPPGIHLRIQRPDMPLSISCPETLPSISSPEISQSNFRQERTLPILRPEMPIPISRQEVSLPIISHSPGFSNAEIPQNVSEFQGSALPISPVVTSRPPSGPESLLSSLLATSPTPESFSLGNEEPRYQFPLPQGSPNAQQSPKLISSEWCVQNAVTVSYHQPHPPPNVSYPRPLNTFPVSGVQGQWNYLNSFPNYRHPMNCAQRMVVTDQNYTRFSAFSPRYTVSHESNRTQARSSTSSYFHHPRTFTPITTFYSTTNTTTVSSTPQLRLYQSHQIISSPMPIVRNTPNVYNSPRWPIPPEHQHRCHYYPVWNPYEYPIHLAPQQHPLQNIHRYPHYYSGYNGSSNHGNTQQVRPPVPPKRSRSMRNTGLTNFPTGGYAGREGEMAKRGRLSFKNLTRHAATAWSPKTLHRSGGFYTDLSSAGGLDVTEFMFKKFPGEFIKNLTFYRNVIPCRRPDSPIAIPSTEVRHLTPSCPSCFLFL